MDFISRHFANSSYNLIVFQHFNKYLITTHLYTRHCTGVYGRYKKKIKEFLKEGPQGVQSPAELEDKQGENITAKEYSN